jgi:cell wall-associated NlpC family hydrolase
MIVETARTWLGTPFHHQGRVKGAGVDCIGLVIGVARELGIWAPDFDYRDYGRQPNNGVLLREISKHCEPCTMEEGCILLMRWFKEPQHVAIYTGGTIIHSAETFGKVVEHGYDRKWAKRTVHAFRYVNHG